MAKFRLKPDTQATLIWGDGDQAHIRVVVPYRLDGVIDPAAEAAIMSAADAKADVPLATLAAFVNGSGVSFPDWVRGLIRTRVEGLGAGGHTTVEDVRA